ncbi:MAG: sulfotransferase [Planctomycetes bacterium]|nr:sulfotransferase [Planctomycetota bacterium]
MAQLGYILAASHSGSTLLAMLLGSHPRACTVGELKLVPAAMGDVDRYRCSCGSLIRACSFWSELTNRMARRGLPFDIADARTDYQGVHTWYLKRLLSPLHRGPMLEHIRDFALSVSPTWQSHLPRTHCRNAALTQTIAELTGSTVIVDSSKGTLRLKYLLLNGDLEVKAVRLIRDGRAVALTYMDPLGFADARDPMLRNGGTPGNRQIRRLTMAQAAHQWKRSNEEAELLVAGLDASKLIEVRYEDLCHAPTETLDRIFTFLNLEPLGRIPRFRDVDHHVVGNGMRLDSTEEIKLDERWRSVLTEVDLRQFNAVAGRLNRRYGYE